MPNPADPQSWNRFSYVENNPIKYIDPTGHVLIEGSGGGGGPPDIIESPDEDDGDNSPNLPLLPSEDNDSLIPSQLDPPNPPDPPVNWTRITVGTLAFGIFLIGGIATAAIGAAVFFEYPPAGAFICAAGVTLTAISAEGLYQTWRPVLPSSWPDHLIIQDFKFPGE